MSALAAGAVFPKRGDVDYTARLEEAWLWAQCCSVAIDDDRERLDSVKVRLKKGARWLREPDAIHRDNYQDALTLYENLITGKEVSLIALRYHREQCWWWCCQLYAAYVHAPQSDQSDLRRAAGLTKAPTSPRAVWRALRGDENPPGPWPPAKAEPVVLKVKENEQ